MKTKVIMAVLLLVLLITFVFSLHTGCRNIVDESLKKVTAPTEISPGENGKCSQQLRDYMKNHYGVFIPECADHVGGYIDNSLRERMIHVAFDIRLSDWDEFHEGMSIEEMLLLLTNGENLFYGGTTSNANEICSAQFDRPYASGFGYHGYPGSDFAYILFSEPAVSKETGVISFAFCADYTEKIK